MGISTLSRDEHCIAQTREVECTRIVLMEVMKRGWIVVIFHNNLLSILIISRIR